MFLCVSSSVFLYIPLCTFIFPCFPLCSSAYFHVPLFSLCSSVYLYLPLFSFMFLCVLLSSSVFLYVPLCTFISLSGPLCSSVYSAFMLISVPRCIFCLDNSCPKAKGKRNKRKAKEKRLLFSTGGSMKL